VIGFDCKRTRKSIQLVDRGNQGCLYLSVSVGKATSFQRGSDPFAIPLEHIRDAVPLHSRLASGCLRPVLGPSSGYPLAVRCTCPASGRIV
jgi:hypothetical protein